MPAKIGITEKWIGPAYPIMFKKGRLPQPDGPIMATELSILNFEVDISQGQISYLPRPKAFF